MMLLFLVVVMFCVLVSVRDMSFVLCFLVCWVIVWLMRMCCIMVEVMVRKWVWLF